MTRHLVFGGLLLIGTFVTPAEQTLALWTTTTSTTANQFSAGTLHIANSLGAGTTLSMDHLIAGDNFDAQLDVNNSGSLPLVYSLTTTIGGSSATLASTLLATIRLKTTNPCASRDGTQLYSGALNAAFIGDPSHGVQAGDRMLAPGVTESLCFTIVVPDTAGATLAGAQASATFALSAEPQ